MAKQKAVSIPKKDEYTRIAFLYQASAKLLENPALKVLSRGYNRSATTIAKKAVLKLTPSMKRTMCKKCNVLLVPGKTLRVRLENLSKQKTEHNDVLVYECMECSTKKRFPVGMNKEFVVFSERDDVRQPASGTKC